MKEEPNFEALDDLELNDLLLSVIRHMHRRHPDTQYLVLTLPKDDPSERLKIIQSLQSFVSQTEQSVPFSAQDEGQVEQGEEGKSQPQ